MSTSPKNRVNIPVVQVLREPRKETIAYAEYVKVKLERNEARRDLQDVINAIENASFWKRIKYLINGKR